VFFLYKLLFVFIYYTITLNRNLLFISVENSELLFWFLAVLRVFSGLPQLLI